MVMTTIVTSDRGFTPLLGKRVKLMQGVAKLNERVRSLAAFFFSLQPLAAHSKRHSKKVSILASCVVSEPPSRLAGNGSLASLMFLLLHQHLVRLPYIWPARHRHLALLGITNVYSISLGLEVVNVVPEYVPVYPAHSPLVMCRLKSVTTAVGPPARTSQAQLPLSHFGCWNPPSLIADYS